MCPVVICGASPVALEVKNLPAIVGEVRDPSSIPGSGDPLEEGMAAPSSILAWRIPWTEEPGGLQSHGVAKSWIRLKQRRMHVMCTLLAGM